MGVMEYIRKAVALGYSGSGESPRVVAKARGELVRALLELAEKHKITVYRDPDLAESLIAMDTGAEINPRLFRAVAEVLAYCYRVNDRFREKLGDQV